jgi:hypothetical protein
MGKQELHTKINILKTVWDWRIILKWNLQKWVVGKLTGLLYLYTVNQLISPECSVLLPQSPPVNSSVGHFIAFFTSMNCFFIALFILSCHLIFIQNDFLSRVCPRYMDTHFFFSDYISSPLYHFQLLWHAAFHTLSFFTGIWFHSHERRT